MVGLDRDGYPEVLHVGCDEAVTRNIRNRACKGRGDLEGLSFVRMTSVIPESTSETTG